MSRISIDVTEDEHKRLKALAALKGVTLKDFLLSNSLYSSTNSEEKNLEELESFLRDRIHRAEKEGASPQTVDEIFDAVCAEKGIASQNG